MHFKSLIVGAVLASGVTLAQAQGAAGRALLPMLDFDRIHAVLVERCTTATPQQMPALKDAIDSWRKQHYVPQRLLQAYALAQIAAEKGTADIAQGKTALKLMQDESVDKFTRESASWDASKMRQYCEDYPQNLQSPEMNFAQIQKEQKARIDAKRNRAQPQTEPSK
jgi:hypothetical protein